MSKKVINLRPFFKKYFMMKWSPKTDLFCIWCSKRGEEVFVCDSITISELNELESAIKLMKQAREAKLKEKQNEQV